MGLPSGLLWADRNVGAATPEANGIYYAWGETQPKANYRWATYRYCTVDEEGIFQTLTKYNTESRYGTPDNLTTLQPSDDAAMVNWGNGARTPTKDEWKELIDNTEITWTATGVILTAANGNTLFLPAAGYRNSDEYSLVGERGDYWSATLSPEDSRDAFCTIFRVDENHQDYFYAYRQNGRSVRPVRDAR